MPLTLPGASSFSFFKGPSLTTTTTTTTPPPLISNNEPVSTSSLSTTASSMNFNETRDPCNNTFFVESNIDNDNTKSEKSSDLLNPVVHAERRARSVDAAMNRNRRGSNCSSRASNKKSVWFRTFMLRLQQTFFKLSNEPEDQVKADDNLFPSRTRSSVDAVRQVVRDEPTNDKKNIILSSDNGNIGSASRLLKPKDQGPCDVVASSNCDSSSHRQSTSSVFEICAQIPRHKTKEREVLRQVGRFTIVREPEDFDTIIFDQCHCLQKPCKYSSSGGVHPPSPPDLLSELMPHSFQTRQQPTGQILQHLPRNPSLTSRSGPPRYTLYSQPPSISSSSRRSLPSLCSDDNNSNNNLMNANIRLPSLSNTIPPASRTIRVMATAANVTSDTLCRKILPTSASSPNLMNLRPKNESVWNNNKLRPPSSTNVHVNNGGPPATVRTKKSSIVNIHQEFLSNRKHNSAPTPFSPFHISLPSKVSVSPNEPHATISSHSGRKFEVEWCSSSVASSNSSSSSSSESASSPASTSSVFSFASSPGTNSHSPATTLSRQRSSTLSSKHGRKFEVTVLSSDNNATTNNN